MFHLDRPMYLLGYLAAQSKVYLIDKVSLSSLLSLLPKTYGLGVPPRLLHSLLGYLAA